MLVVVTRNVPARFRGFLLSVLLEVGPGVYLGARVNKSVRERVWETLEDWWSYTGEDSGVLMLWKDRSSPSGIALESMGWPKRQILDIEGIWLARTRVPTEGEEALSEKEIE